MQLDTKELKTITLLYVEDDEFVRQQTVVLFEKIFKKVFVAINGEDGFNIFSKNKDEIEIIITDINMPILNGLDMVKKINEMSINIPIIVTTAYTDSTNLLNAIDLNIDKYISKPVQIRELTLNIVNLVLKYRRSKNIEILAKGLVEKSNNDDKTTKKLQTELDIKTGQVNYYETIIDNFVFTFKTNKIGDIEDVSTKFYHFFNYTKDEILGKNVSFLKCDSCAGDSFQQLMLKAIHMKKTISSTHHTFITNENKRVNFDVTMTPNYGSDNLVNGYTFYLDLVLN